MKRALLILWLSAAASFGGQVLQPSTLSPDELKEIGIVQRLGNRIPLGLEFTESDGSGIGLDALLARKPTLLVPVYYECPNLCTVVLNALVQSLADLRRTAGDGFQVVAISIDPREAPALAAVKKASYVRLYGRGSPDDWHFLTGDAESIRRLTEAVGYRYRLDAKSGQFAHGSGVVVVDRRGAVVQYLLGIEYRPQAIESALQLAQREKTGSSVRDLLLLCYHYNPLTGPHGTAIAWGLRVTALLFLAGLGGYIGRQLYRERRA
jgi:protein SCO1/2